MIDRAHEKEPLTERLAIAISPTLRAELEAEAWEEQRTFSDYVRRLLEQRGKWARTVGSGGGYALGELEPGKDDGEVP